MTTWLMAAGAVGATLMALGLASCARDTKKDLVVEEGTSLDAGPRPLEALDCRTHTARPDTGEVTRKQTAPFAEVRVEHGHAVLREGLSETFRVRLDGVDAGQASSGPSDGVVLAHRAVVRSGGRVVALDRQTGKVVWTLNDAYDGLLGLPGDLVLAYTGTRAVAFASKTGKEAFRFSLTPTSARSFELVDERLLVARTPGHVVVIDPPLASGNLGPTTPLRLSEPVRRASAASHEVRARLDLEGDAIGFFTARAAHGDLFVATKSRLVRIHHGAVESPEDVDGAIVWSSDVPFGDATGLSVLDTDDSVFVAAYDRGRDTDVTVRGYEVRGEELRSLFDAKVARHPASPVGCTHEVALGLPANELVVASICGASSVVAQVNAKTGKPMGRAAKP